MANKKGQGKNRTVHTAKRAKIENCPLESNQKKETKKNVYKHVTLIINCASNLNTIIFLIVFTNVNTTCSYVG